MSDMQLPTPRYRETKFGVTRITTPIYGVFSEYVLGLAEYGELIKQQDAKLREGTDPASLDKPFLDFRNWPLAGATAPEKHLLRLRIKGKYPQWKYWMQMTFMAPVPWEADAFYAQPGMAERKYGRIVNIASDAARGGSSGEAVYSACKGGLVALSKTLAREHARQSITVNVVCPGPTDTALLAGVAEGARDPAKLIEAFRSAIPLGRLGQPDDLASAIAFFGSDDAGFITGQVISVSGGLTMHG